MKSRVRTRSSDSGGMLNVTRILPPKSHDGTVYRTTSATSHQQQQRAHFLKPIQNGDQKRNKQPAEQKEQQLFLMAFESQRPQRLTVPHLPAHIEFQSEQSNALIPSTTSPTSSTSLSPSPPPDASLIFQRFQVWFQEQRAERRKVEERYEQKMKMWEQEEHHRRMKYGEVDIDIDQATTLPPPLPSLSSLTIFSYPRLQYNPPAAPISSPSAASTTSSTTVLKYQTHLCEIRSQAELESVLGLCKDMVQNASAGNRDSRVKNQVCAWKFIVDGDDDDEEEETFSTGYEDGTSVGAGLKLLHLLDTLYLTNVFIFITESGGGASLNSSSKSIAAQARNHSYLIKSAKIMLEDYVRVEKMLDPQRDTSGQRETRLVERVDLQQQDNEIIPYQQDDGSAFLEPYDSASNTVQVYSQLPHSHPSSQQLLPLLTAQEEQILRQELLLLITGEASVHLGFNSHNASNTTAVTAAAVVSDPSLSSSSQQQQQHRYHPYFTSLWQAYLLRSSHPLHEKATRYEIGQTPDMSGSSTDLTTNQTQTTNKQPDYSTTQLRMRKERDTNRRYRQESLSRSGMNVKTQRQLTQHLHGTSGMMLDGFVRGGSSKQRESIGMMSLRRGAGFHTVPVIRHPVDGSYASGGNAMNGNQQQQYISQPHHYQPTHSIPHHRTNHHQHITSSNPSTPWLESQRLKSLLPSHRLTLTYNAWHQERLQMVYEKRMEMMLIPNINRSALMQIAQEYERVKPPFLVRVVMLCVGVLTMQHDSSSPSTTASSQQQITWPHVLRLLKGQVRVSFNSEQERRKSYLARNQHTWRTWLEEQDRVCPLMKYQNHHSIGSSLTAAAAAATSTSSSTSTLNMTPRSASNGSILSSASSTSDTGESSNTEARRHVLRGEQAYADLAADVARRDGKMNEEDGINSDENSSSSFLEIPRDLLAHLLQTSLVTITHKQVHRVLSLLSEPSINASTLSTLHPDSTALHMRVLYEWVLLTVRAWNVKEAARKAFVEGVNERDEEEEETREDHKVTTATNGFTVREQEEKVEYLMPQQYYQQKQLEEYVDDTPSQQHEPLPVLQSILSQQPQQTLSSHKRSSSRKTFSPPRSRPRSRSPSKSTFDEKEKEKSPKIRSATSSAAALGVPDLNLSAALSSNSSSRALLQTNTEEVSRWVSETPKFAGENTTVTME